MLSGWGPQPDHPVAEMLKGQSVAYGGGGFLGNAACAARILAHACGLGALQQVGVVISIQRAKSAVPLAAPPLDTPAVQVSGTSCPAAHVHTIQQIDGWSRRPPGSAD